MDSLESDFRPLDFMKEIFKSTPNLNNKETVGGGAVVGGKRSPGCGVGYACSSGPLAQHLGQAGHTRSTSYSVSYCMRKASGSPATDNKGKMHNYTQQNLYYHNTFQSFGFIVNLIVNKFMLIITDFEEVN